MTPRSHMTVSASPVDTGGTVLVDLPDGWRIERGPPLVAHPRTWVGEPPAVVVVDANDGLTGERLAATIAHTAATRLGDPLIVDLGIVDDGVEIVVAHRSQGVDVTTIERHHCRSGGRRWVVTFTAVDADAVALAPLMHHVVASLRGEP
jgi:hypothetical protein